MDYLTGQVPDEFIYKGERFELLGIKGKKLFTNEDFGVKPSSFTTACYRGHIMSYQFTNNQLLLDSFFITSDNPPKINNIDPIRLTNKNPEVWWHSMFEYRYEHLNLKVPFNGEILLGKDFIHSMDPHMGHPPAIAYKTVLRFHLKDGTITKIEDESKKIEKEREKAKIKRRKK